MNLTQVDDLQMLHVQAAKEIRTFRNSVKHADRYKEMAADLPVNTYALNQERAYREQAQECAERYQEIQLQIISLTDNMVLCPKLQLA